VVFPPVVITQATRIHVCPKRETKLPSPAQLFQPGPDLGAISGSGSRLTQRGSCKKAFDVRPTSIGLHPAPVRAIHAEPPAIRFLTHARTTYQHTKAQQSGPIESNFHGALNEPAGECLTRSIRQPLAYFCAPVVSAPVFFFIIGARPLSGVSPA
jgi:hypothetical protein